MRVVSTLLALAVSLVVVGSVMAADKALGGKGGGRAAMFFNESTRWSRD